MSKISVNFKLYKATALLNVRYDNESYKEGSSLDIRPTDIEELTSRGYVKMEEMPEENTTPPIEPNQTPEETNIESSNDGKQEGDSNTQGGE
jgi:hypothetical protein